MDDLNKNFHTEFNEKILLLQQETAPSRKSEGVHADALPVSFPPGHNIGLNVGMGSIGSFGGAGGGKNNAGIGASLLSSSVQAAVEEEVDEQEFPVTPDGIAVAVDENGNIVQPIGHIRPDDGAVVAFENTSVVIGRAEQGEDGQIKAVVDMKKFHAAAQGGSAGSGGPAGQSPSGGQNQPGTGGKKGGKGGGKKGKKR